MIFYFNRIEKNVEKMNMDKERKRIQKNGNSHESKSQRLSGQKGNENGFVEGSIVRIKLSKFLTYDAVEIRPGPHLNVIIGPNGTGKSAIVCAICLGLAGKTSWLGRATDPKDYIRHGADKATIEIELFNPVDEQNYTIKREITFSKASSWWVNGRQATQKAVEATVSRLNIQVGNLCQFLPQEKVADFAKMSQQELLENTEKSVGEEGMFEKHQELKRAREEARMLESDVGKLVEDLKQEKQRNARLEPDVKAFNDRKNFLKKVEILKMKKPWVEYQMLKQSHDLTREEKDSKGAELKQQQRHLQPLLRRHENLKEEKNELDTKCKERSRLMRNCTKLIDDRQKQMSNIADQIMEVRQEYDSKVNEEQSRKKRLSDLQDQLKALENGLAAMDGSDRQKIVVELEQNAKNLRNVNMEMSNVQAEGENLKREINNIRAETKDVEHQLKQIKDVNIRKLENLRQIHQHTYDAVLWLRNNRDKFKKHIYEPMIICLNVINPADAKIVETHISLNDLRAFICEDPSDLDLFLTLMKREKLKVNSVLVPQSAENYKPVNPIAHYRKYGFKNYIQDLFTCPAPVLSFLCKMYRVYAIPVGSEAVAQQSERIISNCPEFNNFYTPSEQYSVKKSRYTNNVSTRNSALREPRALGMSVNVEREQELTRLIKEARQNQQNHEDEYRELQQKSEDFEKKINMLRQEKRDLLKQKDQRKNLESQIITKKQRIQQVANENIDLNVEEQKMKKQLKAVVTEQKKCLNKMMSDTDQIKSLAKEHLLCSFKLQENDHIFMSIEVELRTARQKTEGLEREVELLKEQVRDLKQQARDKLIEAKRIAEIGPNDQLEEKLRERNLWDDFHNAPSQIDELEGEINNMTARAESMFQVDEQVVEDYNKREENIQLLEQKLNRQESSRSNHQDNVLKLREEWITPLTELIGRINTNFSFFFSSLQCCGEVSLNVPENPEDYEKYGVTIKVKFRDDENLRELTAHHQSGGERSVSTVLYLMALQELTRCPFRCVDEINQGMDPRNERKVFQLVVQTVCKRSSSQYFLLTPKLLPDLEYGDHMTVLCVYNGPEMLNHKHWDLKKFVSRRAAIED